jgi:hypothetical protein
MPVLDLCLRHSDDTQNQPRYYLTVNFSDISYSTGPVTS